MRVAHKGSTTARTVPLCKGVNKQCRPSFDRPVTGTACGEKKRKNERCKKAWGDSNAHQGSRLGDGMLPLTVSVYLEQSKWVPAHPIA